MFRTHKKEKPIAMSIIQENLRYVLSMWPIHENELTKIKLIIDTYMRNREKEQIIEVSRRCPKHWNWFTSRKQTSDEDLLHSGHYSSLQSWATSKVVHKELETPEM